MWNKILNDAGTLWIPFITFLNIFSESNDKSSEWQLLIALSNAELNVVLQTCKNSISFMQQHLFFFHKLHLIWSGVIISQRTARCKDFKAKAIRLNPSQFNKQLHSRPKPKPRLNRIEAKSRQRPKPAKLL